MLQICVIYLTYTANFTSVSSPMKHQFHFKVSGGPSSFVEGRELLDNYKIKLFCKG